MDKKPFDFKDLMAFGMFVLALLTFVFTFLKECFSHRKTTLIPLTGLGWHFYVLAIGQPLVGGSSFFHL